jgi:hypothetical protein
MNTIRIRTLTPWKYYLILFGSTPLWVITPIIVIHANGFHKYIIYGMGLILFALCIFLTHILSRKWTVFTYYEGQIDFDNYKKMNLIDYTINNSGYGLTQFRLILNSEKTIKILVPKYGKNPEKLEEFLKEYKV